MVKIRHIEFSLETLRKERTLVRIRLRWEE
jgi:hypothetical protein